MNAIVFIVLQIFYATRAGLKIGEYFRIFPCFKPRPNDPNMSTQHIATLLDATDCMRLATMLRYVGCCWLKFEIGQIWANNTQHVATCRNMVAKHTQHVVSNNVAICCDDMLRSFGRGFSWGIFAHVTRLDQARASENIIWIINKQ